jgi:integrase
MRVRLKALNRITKRLADGSEVTYYYAWKGGPRVKGEPGTPEFIASYNEAVAHKASTPSGQMVSILRYYEKTCEFDSLAERTKEDYRKKIALIENKFGDLPLAALADKRARGIFKEWRDELAKSSRRQADYAWVVLARVLAVAKDRGKIDTNPCERGGRVYDGSRRDIIWSLEDEEAYLERAPAHMRLPLLLAVWTGQRQGDLLRLPWTAYDGQYIRLRQSKTGARVQIRVVGPLKAALDAAAKHKTSVLILNTSEGRPWTGDGFRSSWRKACANAGLSGLTFHDLRGTAVTRLALAGGTEVEIANYTGLSLTDVRAILDKHYLSRDPRFADSAAAKLERAIKKGTNSPNYAPNWPTGSKDPGRKTE